MIRIRGDFDDDSDWEFERNLKSAVEQYRNNQKPERKNDSKKNEAVHADEKWPRNSRERSKTDIGYFLGNEMKSCVKDYENQGAIPRRIYNKRKSNGRKEKRWREQNNSQSPVSRSPSRGRQFNKKSGPGRNNSGLDKNIPNGNTANKKAKAREKFLQSFYYVVPEEPSTDFCLSPGSYYVVSKPIDLSIETVVIFHPQRSEKHSTKDHFKGGTRYAKAIENIGVSPTNLNDLNKSERNCSNVNLVRDLISDYNSKNSNVEIMKNLKILKPDLEAEIEELKSALTESTTALDQLKMLEFSLNSTMTHDKEFGNKEINIKEDFKGTESSKENDAETKSPVENYFVNEGDDGGGLNVAPVEDSPENKELTTASEERIEAKEKEKDPLPSHDQDIRVDEFSEERRQEDMINKMILHVTSVLPDINEDYLRNELQKMKGHFESINVFTDNLFEEKNYPKSDVNPGEIERKRLWKEYVIDFNPKKFLFELSTVQGATASHIFDNDDNYNDNLDMAFLRTRYPNQSPERLVGEYEYFKSLEAVCESLDKSLEPVRLSESAFRRERFNKEFLLKVTYLDHQQEIEDFLSAIQKKKELEREEARLCNAFLQCLTCFAKIVPVETTTCRDGHVFCSYCVEQYIRVELGKGIYEFKCFSGDCNAVFDHKTLEELLPASILSKISMKQQAKEIMEAKVDGVESCTSCDFVYVPNPDDKIFKCQNPECLAEICRNCHERNHIPLRCDEIERSTDVEARKIIEEIMTSTLVRSCPSCGKEIVKIDGCNKMSCTCGTKFCYLCRKQIFDYSHFDTECSLYSDNTELHVERVEAAGIRARDGLLKENPGIRILYDPTQNF